MKIHPIRPGAWCIPSAIQALTGADYESVIHPALNRHAKRRGGLTDIVVGECLSIAVGVLEELSYNVRPYKGAAERSRLTTWSERSQARWPGRALLVASARHALVVKDGRVHDTYAPFGMPGAEHPCRRQIITWAALVEEKR